MKIRLKKPYSIHPLGWTGECEDSVATRLVADGVAESVEPVLVEAAVIEPEVSQATANPKRSRRGRVSNAQGADASGD